METVAIVGDTHVPSREPSVPAWVRERVGTADHVVHVGDYDDPAVLAEFEDLAADLVAVAGNMDPADLDLPAVATLDVEDVRFVVTHGTGSPAGYEDRVVATARDHAGDGTTVAVGGHLHQVIDTTHDGLRLLNPGSASGAAPAEAESMLTVTVDGDEVTVEIHWGDEEGTVHR